MLALQDTQPDATGLQKELSSKQKEVSRLLKKVEGLQVFSSAQCIVFFINPGAYKKPNCNKARGSEC